MRQSNAAPAIANAWGVAAMPTSAPEHRHVGARRQPQLERKGAHQPVGLELGQPGEGVDHADLEAEQPHPARAPRVAGPPAPAGVERQGPAQRRHHRERRDQGEEPVVVEVGGGVDQLDPPEAHQQPGRREPASASRRSEGRPTTARAARPARASATSVGWGTHPKPR